MTREEAIHTLNFGAWWDNLNPEMSDADSVPLFEALDMAISALRAQQERESNEPLTLDELRHMERKPVWAIDGTGTAAYILIDADGNGIDTDSGFWDADYYGMTKDGKPSLHRMGWLAYRHQLKNTTEG